MLPVSRPVSLEARSHDLFGAPPTAHMRHWMKCWQPQAIVHTVPMPHPQAQNQIAKQMNKNKFKKCTSCCKYIQNIPTIKRDSIFAIIQEKNTNNLIFTNYALNSDAITYNL